MAYRTDDHSELSCVQQRLAPVILPFCSEVSRQPTQQFYLAEVNAAVSAAGIPHSPNSPYRILALLRQQGAIDYVIVDRRASKYRLTYIQPQADLFPHEPRVRRVTTEANPELEVSREERQRQRAQQRGGRNGGTR